MKKILTSIGIGIICALALFWILIMLGEKESRERLLSFVKDGIGWGIFWMAIFVRFLLKAPLTKKQS